MSRAPRNSPITEHQWEHIFGILDGACYGSNAVQVAWEWLRSNGSVMQLSTFYERLRKERRARNERAAAGAAEAAAAATAAVLMVDAVPLGGASVVAEGEPSGLKRTHEAALDSVESAPPPPALACPHCARALQRFVDNAPCYVATEDTGSEAVVTYLCRACYVAREEELEQAGSALSTVERRAGDGAVMACLVRRRGERTVGEAAVHEELDAVLRRAVLALVQGGRRQHVHGVKYATKQNDGPQMDKLIRATIAARQAGLNVGASSVMQRQAGVCDVCVSHLEVLHSEVLLGPDVMLVTDQAPHIDEQPARGAQFIIFVGPRTNLHTLVYDVSGITHAQLACAVDATQQQLKCPRWNELLEENRPLLVAVAFRDPEPAFHGALNPGDVMFLANRLVHFGRGMQAGEPPRVLVVGSATDVPVADAPLEQKQFMDAAAQNGLPQFLHGLCMRKPELAAHLLSGYFLGRTRHRAPNGHPELTWTADQWRRFIDCVDTREPPSAEFAAELIAQSQYVQFRNNGISEPHEWLGPVRVKRNVSTAAPECWHPWTLADENADAEDERALTMDLSGSGWHSEALQLASDSCSCTVTVMVTASDGVKSVLETVELHANDRVRIVPSAVSTGGVSIRWKEHEAGKLKKTYQNYDVHGVPMTWDTARIECDACHRQVVEATWRYNAVETLEYCNACNPTGPNWAEATHEALGLAGGRDRVALHGLTVPALRNLLQTRKLRMTGSKSELVERLEQHDVAPAQLERNRAY